MNNNIAFLNHNSLNPINSANTPKFPQSNLLNSQQSPKNQKEELAKTERIEKPKQIYNYFTSRIPKNQIESKLKYIKDERFQFFIKHGILRRYDGDCDTIYVEIPQIPNKIVVYRRPISRMKSIDRLNLSKKDLPHIPLFEGEENLQYLSLEINQIHKIDQLISLNNLVYLNLYFNKISEIDNLQTTPKIKVLLLGKNEICKIKNLQYLHDLEILDLHSNKIQLVENLKCLKKLRILNLANNLIKHIDELIYNKLLEELNIRKNQIEIIPNLTNYWDCVHKLNLGKNLISKVEYLAEIRKLKNLRELIIEDNPVLYLKEAYIYIRFLPIFTPKNEKEVIQEKNDKKNVVIKPFDSLPASTTNKNMLTNTINLYPEKRLTRRNNELIKENNNSIIAKFRMNTSNNNLFNKLDKKAFTEADDNLKNVNSTIMNCNLNSVSAQINNLNNINFNQTGILEKKDSKSNIISKHYKTKGQNNISEIFNKNMINNIWDFTNNGQSAQSCKNIEKKSNKLLLLNREELTITNRDCNNNLKLLDKVKEKIDEDPSNDNVSANKTNKNSSNTLADSSNNQNLNLNQKDLIFEPPKDFNSSNNVLLNLNQSSTLTNAINLALNNKLMIKKSIIKTCKSIDINSNNSKQISLEELRLIKILNPIKEKWNDELRRIINKGFNGYNARKYTENNVNIGHFESNENQLIIYGDSLNILKNEEYIKNTVSISFNYFNYDFIINRNSIELYNTFNKLSTMHFNNNCLYSFYQINKLENINNLECLSISNNEICGCNLLKYFLIYRMTSLKSFNNELITEGNKETTKKLFEYFDFCISNNELIKENNEKNKIKGYMDTNIENNIKNLFDDKEKLNLKNNENNIITENDENDNDDNLRKYEYFEYVKINLSVAIKEIIYETIKKEEDDEEININN